MKHLRSAVAAGAFCCSTIAMPAYAGVITDPAFFGPGSTFIDFEDTPAIPGTLPADEEALASQYAALGVLFSSEDVADDLQTTDPADASGRFGTTAFFRATIGGGGAPTSGERYISGQLQIQAFNLESSDLRIDFTKPVIAFGMQIIDNDFSTARLSAFSADGTLLQSVIVPEVAEGGVSYFGIDSSDLGAAIAYAILDGADGGPLDSTFIDDLSFQQVPVPPAALLMAAPLAALFRKRRAG